MATEKPTEPGAVAPATIPKTISSASNLANLLPTGTVLAFETLIPSFSNNGSCHPSNKGLTISIIVTCALLCFFSSFTDSFVDSTDGKLYYGIVTRNGMYILNSKSEDTKQRRRRLRGYRRMPLDHFHAFMSLTLFLIYALTNLNVKHCFFPEAGENLSQVIINLPLGAGIFACFLFTIFPTTRRGIGFTLPPGNVNEAGGQASTTTSIPQGSAPEKVKGAEGQTSTTTTTPQGSGRSAPKKVKEAGVQASTTTTPQVSAPKKEVVVVIEAEVQPLATTSTPTLNHSRCRSY